MHAADNRDVESLQSTIIDRGGVQRNPSSLGKFEKISKFLKGYLSMLTGVWGVRAHHSLALRPNRHSYLNPIPNFKLLSNDTQPSESDFKKEDEL